MFVVFGRNLGPTDVTRASELPLAVELAGTRVTVGSMEAPIIYTSATQVGAIVPAGLSAGSTEVRVSYMGQTSLAHQVDLVRGSFGIFTINSAGYGGAAAQNFAGGMVALNRLTAPARPGQAVVLYGTGLGETPDDARVRVGTTEVTPLFAGPSPDYPGLDQINFIVPDNAREGCYVPLSVRVAGQTSNTATIAVSGSEGTCSHPLGLSREALRRLDDGGTVNVAVINATGGQARETVLAFINRTDASLTYTQTPVPGAQDGREVPRSAGQCTNWRQEASMSASGPRQVTGAPLDAGRLEVVGPAGRSAELALVAGGLFYADLSQWQGRFFEGGAWTFRASGGQDVRTFSMAGNQPGPLTWTNRTASISRSSPLTVNWTGGPQNGLIAISGTSFWANPQNLADAHITGFICAADVRDGTFTVPGDVMRQMSPSNAQVFGGSNGMLTLSAGAMTTLGAEEAAAAGLDGAVFLQSTVSSMPAQYP
jgi:uncharacterized protein (TIGR03437 family)